jgi:sugar-specific transcriptional regulator TrmB
MMAIYIDEPFSKIIERLEQSVKDSQKDIDRLERTLENDESPVAVIDSLRGGNEDHLAYCKDLREMIKDIKGLFC